MHTKLPTYLGLLALTLLATPASGQAYQTEVNRWVAQDAADPVASGGIVFAGSSSIRRWEELTLDFADYNVLQRGLGGATFDSYQPHVDDAIIAHSPRAVVVWLGTNDIAGGATGRDVAADFQTFVDSIHAPLPNTEVFYLGIMPTPGRMGNRAQENVANRAISGIAANDPRVHYIDLPAVFDGLGAYTGADFTNKFVDSIHLNRDGYDVWESVVRPAIEAEFAPDKIYVANPNGLKPGEQLLFDFGPNNSLDGDHTLGADQNGHIWNNWHSANGGANILPGEHIGDLVNTAGNPTGIGLTITAQFESNGKRNGGLASPDEALLGDLAVGSATVDYFFSTADGVQGGGDDDDGGGFMITGLDPNLSYDFKLFGTRNSGETRVSEYTLTGANSVTAVLQTSGADIGADGSYDGNDDEVAVLEGVRPDEFGQVFFDMTKLQGSFAYIGAMQITATPEPTSLGLALTLAAGLGASRSRPPR